MPSLEEVRRWLQGENVDGLPARSLAWAKRMCATPNDESKSRMNLADLYRKKRDELQPMSGRYTISVDGEDAVLKFGQHKGKSISELVKTPSGFSYLDWLEGLKFPKEFIDVIDHQKQLLADMAGTYPKSMDADGDIDCEEPDYEDEDV